MDVYKRLLRALSSQPEWKIREGIDRATSEAHPLRVLIEVRWAEHLRFSLLNQVFMFTFKLAMCALASYLFLAVFRAKFSQEFAPAFGILQFLCGAATFAFAILALADVVLIPEGVRRRHRARDFLKENFARWSAADVDEAEAMLKRIGQR
ncbi:MAG: hypothetical protein ABIH41_07255 [Nanoarchaeota archaeon]